MGECKYVRAVQIGVVLQLWIALAAGQMGLGMGFGGGGGLGGFGMSRTRNIERNFGPNSILAQAVREIVHPNARQTRPIMEIAMRHQGPPSSMAMLLEYTPHFVDLAYRHGVRINGSVPTLEDMQKYIVDRGVKFSENRGFFTVTTTARPPSSNTTAAAPPSGQAGRSQTAGTAANPAYSTNNGGTGYVPYDVATSSPFAGGLHLATTSSYDNFILMQFLMQNMEGSFF